MPQTCLSQLIKYLVVIASISLSTRVLAQSFYVAEPTGRLVRITLKGATATYQAIDNACTTSVGSIAVHKNTLYYYSGGSFYKATIAGNKLTNCQYVGNYTIENNALTVDKNGILYGAIRDRLYKIDPANGAFTMIGTMPYESAGDLTFYKDELYLASGAGIVKLNLNDLSQSSVVIRDAGGAYGIALVPYSSTENKVYVFNQTTITEIDLDNNVVKNEKYTTNLVVYDAASVVEDGSVAKVQIDSIRQYADCPFTGKGTIEVICYNALADYTYELNGVTNTTGKFTGLNPGNYNIKVRSNLEVKDTAITVTRFFVEKPILKIDSVDNLCFEPGQIKLSAKLTNNLVYTVSYNNAIYPINYTYNNLKQGTHRFIVLNDAGCAVDTAEVILHKCEIKLEAVEVQQECNLTFRAAVRVRTAAHNGVHTYKLGNTTNLTGFFQGVEKGTHRLTITSADDIEETDVIVPDYEALGPVVSYKAVNAICETLGGIKFNITGNATGYTIKLDSETHPFSQEFKLPAGNYTFTVIKPNGCPLNLYQATITSQSCETVVFPNTFTPNNDGVNDTFAATKNSKASNYKLKLYSRNGNLLFTAVDIGTGWDGNHNGKPVPTGVYYYVATYVNNMGENLSKSGYVNLVR